MNTQPPDIQDAELIAAAEALSKTLAERAAHHDRHGSFPVEGLKAITESPLNTALLDGASMTTCCRIVGILSRGDASFGTAWLMHAGCAAASLALADPEQVAFFSAEIRRGAWIGNALSEPTSGNRFLFPQQVAERVEGGWRLSGTKRFVSGCEQAKYLLTSALCDGKPMMFIVDMDDSIVIDEVWDTMGMRATRSQLLQFHNTLLPASRVVHLDPSQPNFIALGLAWISIGIAEAALACAIDYAKQRKLPPNDRPLAELQWVQFAVADMDMRLQAARALATHAAQTADRRAPEAMTLQMQSKVVANEAAVAIARSALEIAGGSGYFRTRPIERHLRDAMSGPIMAWSSAVVRDFTGKMLLGIEPT